MKTDSTKLSEDQPPDDDIDNDDDENKRQADGQLMIAEFCFGFDTK